MNHLAPDRPNQWGFKRPLFSVICLSFFLAGPVAHAHAQEVTLPELEGLYRSALLGYEQAFEVLEVLSSQFERASLDLANAVAADDETAKNRAYAESLRISGEMGQAQRRVEEKVLELREARGTLLDATAEYLGDLLAVGDTATDPVTQGDLRSLVSDKRTRISELIELEDPPVTLEPVPNINAAPRDGPIVLRQKATMLEVTASRYEGQYAFNEQKLEDLRRDQDLLRRSGDFLAGIIRFDDPRLPVGPPGARTDPPPGQAQAPPGADSLGIEGGFLTLEQRIEALETLQEEITQRIQTIRVRAANLRRLAGGEWA